MVQKDIEREGERERERRRNNDQSEWIMRVRLGDRVWEWERKRWIKGVREGLERETYRERKRERERERET